MSIDPNKLDAEGFFESHKSHWKEPQNFSLLKETDNLKEYYSIFQIWPKLMMMLCDDFDYAVRLSMKMIDSGVKVFDDFSELSEWHKIKLKEFPVAEDQ